MGAQEPINLESLLEILNAAGKGERLTVGDMLEAVGRRSFGPLLLVPGLIAFSPLSGIPGMPTAVGIMVTILSSQLLLGRRYFWMPQWVLRRSVSRTNFERAYRFMVPIARCIDKLIRPRLVFLTSKAALYLVSVLALLVGLITPLLELLPFVISIAGAALTAFALALIARDGLLLLVALLFYTAAIWFIVMKLLG